MANDIKLQSPNGTHPVDENLRPILVGDKPTSIETAQHGDGARVTGDLIVTGDITGNIKDMVLEDVTVDSLIIDKDTNITTSAVETCLHVDYDHTGIAASAQTVQGVGLDIDMNCETVTHVGYIFNTGIDLDMVAATDSLQINTGMDISCTGADHNRGLNITVPDGASDYHIKLLAADDTSDYALFTVADTGDLTIATVGDGTTDSDLTLDADGIIGLDAGNSDDGVRFLMAGTQVGDLNAHHGATWFTLYENGGASTSDYFALEVELAGATTLVTEDAAGDNAHLTLDVDGDIYFDAHTGKYRFYDAGDLDDSFLIEVTGGTGATSLKTLSAANPGDGHLTLDADGHVEFDGCGVGFDLITPTWGVADGDGTFTTVCSFTTGNKILCTLDRVMGTNDDIDMNFPIVSGNFTLVLLQDGSGSRTVHANAWNCASTAGSGTVKWAGGTAPTLTTTLNKADIVSIFWDADNRIAYAVASLNF